MQRINFWGQGQYAHSGSGSGTGQASERGGSVSIFVDADKAIVLPNPAPIDIDVSGLGHFAPGGTIKINHVKGDPAQATLEVNNVLSADPGSDASFGGILDLNSVACRQYKNPSAATVTYPKMYWDCANQAATLVPTVPIVVSTLHDATYILDPLVANKVRLYLMTSINDWNTFFAANPTQGAPGTIGITLVTPSKSFGVSTVFVTDGQGSPNPYPAATAGHEYGHAMNSLWGRPSDISMGAWRTAVANDFGPGSFINQQPCATVFSASNCAKYDIHTPNSDILKAEYYGGEDITPNEWFAEIFEHQELSAYPEAGREKAVGYLKLMNDYMNAALTSSVHP